MSKRSLARVLLIGLGLGLSAAAVAAEEAPVDDGKAVRAELARLYPHFGPEELEAKIVAARTPFQFFRSFVPYFYERYRQLELPPALRAAAARAGWCVGDAHPENFGALLDARGRARFTVNDLDDAGPCPLAADALRFFAAVAVADPGRDLKPLVHAYKKGLAEEQAELSKPVRELLARSEEKGQQPRDSDRASERKLAREGGAFELAARECEALLQTLRDAYGPALPTLVDAFAYRKTGGGSHGLLRYRTLVELPGLGLQVIELKQLVTPGIFPVASGPIPGAAERVRRSLALEHGPHASPYFQARAALGGEFLLRPRFKGDQGVALDGLDELSLGDILKDEAETLGTLHRRGAFAAEDAAALAGPEAEAWESAARELAGRIAAAFEAVKQKK